jgi:hypothetical protein
MPEKLQEQGEVSKSKWEPAGFQSSEDGQFNIPNKLWGYKEVYYFLPESKRRLWWNEPGLLNAYAVYELDINGKLLKACFAATGIKESGGAGILIFNDSSELIQKLINDRETQCFDSRWKIKTGGSFLFNLLIEGLGDINREETQYKYELYKNVVLDSLAIIRTKKESNGTSTATTT